MSELDTETICEEIIFDLMKHGYRQQVCRRDIEKSVIVTRGIDERTFKRWLKALETFGYLKPMNNQVYEINMLKVPHIISILKKEPQTKIS